MRLRLAVSTVTVVLWVAGAAGAAPKCRPLTDAQTKDVMSKVPDCPADLDLGLKIRLIDFIDCTRVDDPHDFKDQGTSKVVTGPAGAYRVTAPHRHGFFSYAFRTAGRDNPNLIVIEYPDDADRVIGYTTHDSMRPANAHVSFTQETGVLTGGALPVSNTMKYFTLVNWAQDDWSPLVVLNYGRTAGGGAASRIWVYAIDQFEPLKVDAPDPGNQRTLDMFLCLAFLAKRDNFGWKSKESIEHMVDYCRMVGINRVTMEVYANQGWGAMCTAPAWDIPDDKGYLDDILAQMDRKGGVDFIAGIVADGMYGDVKAGGKLVRDLPKDEARSVILKGFDEFIDRYGKYTSFKGFALGSMETIGFYDTLRKHGLVAEVVAHIKKRRPDFTVLTYLGNVRLQTPYFSGRLGSSTSWDLMASFEKGGRNWAEHLADGVVRNWKAYGHDPAAMRAAAGLDVYEMTHPNDHRMHDLYTQEPRHGIYHDVVHSQKLADVADTPYGAVFDTFSEGHIGFHQDVNFWYGKYWTGPDFNFPEQLALMPYALLQARRDRQAVTAGAWTVKYFGYEVFMRRWAKAFRSLPPVDMKPVAVMAAQGAAGAGDVVVARWIVYKGKRYVAVQSRIPFPCGVTVDGKAMVLKPYELVALSDGATGAPGVSVTQAADYAKWVAGRIGAYEALCKKVGALNAAAAPAVYADAARQARRELAIGKPYHADMAVGYGLAEELELRKEILSPPELQAPRIAGAPPSKGDLDAWPKAASDITTDGSNTMGHIYFPNNWRGNKDMAVRLRLAHDGTHLYVGIGVTDDKLTERDSCDIWLSKAGYLDWRGGETDSAKPDFRWPISLPRDKPQIEGTGRAGFTYTCRRTADGYVVEGKAALADLGVKPGGAVGWLVMASEDDDEPTRSKHSWARKMTMVIPNQPHYAAWGDARNCGKLVLGK